jgi:hypothetical protein
MARVGRRDPNERHTRVDLLAAPGQDAHLVASVRHQTSLMA